MEKKIVNIKISDLKIGMIPGKTIIDIENGRVLMKKGIALDEKMIEELTIYFENKKNIKIGGIEAEKSIFKIGKEEHYLPPKTSPYIKSAISQETYQEAIFIVDKIMHNIRIGGSINSKEVEEAIDHIVGDILQNEEAAVNLLNIKDFDDYTYTHSVNVATLSILIGKKMELEKSELAQLGVGALLHDLGKIKIDLKILNKPSQLNDLEFKQMKLHPVYTYELLKGNGEMSDIVKNIASQHHEKFDGKGYPLGLKGKGINSFARIVAVADVYDALTTDRIYRKAMMPYEAMKIIISGTGTHFDPDIVKVFLKALSIYPVGSNVLLNTGELAVIKKVNEKQIIRPEILILKNGEIELTIPMELKLIDDPSRFIIGASKI